MNVFFLWSYNSPYK